MKTITITITVPDGVDFHPVVSSGGEVGRLQGSQPVQNGPYQPAAAQSGVTPVCPKHGAEKVKPSTKGPGFFCTAHDDSGPRGYCTWSVK